jgi:ParB-like chromosome segregation protein Spo0J
VTIDLAELRIAPSFREEGLDHDHVEVLVGLAGQWPPILVDRSDRRVVDGAHRVAAARRLGMSGIVATFFDGGPEEALVEFLQRNVRHGLPLTLRERKRAAQQVLAGQPRWSDRRIAELCGISSKTVGRLRTAPNDGSRVGRDGRTRPVDGASLRSRITEELAARPDASLRAIASAVGASPETVRSVRSSMAGPADAEASASMPASAPEPVPPPWRDDAAILSLTDGDDFVTWFDATTVADDDWQRADGVPLSRIYEIADEARRRARAWNEFAQVLEARSAKKAVRALHAATGTRKAG